MVRRRRVVVDANILIRAVLGRRVRDTITKYAADVDFFAPEVAFADAAEHLPSVLRKFEREGEIEAALELVERLSRVVVAIPERSLDDLKDQALARIQRDPDDWPVLAAALLMDCPIWTEDNDFFGTGVPTWTSDRIELYLGSRA